MIRHIEFENFRNLSGKYLLETQLTMIVGKNSSGKTNLLDGVRYAFSALTGEYIKIEKSDFKDSDDSLVIRIKVALEDGSIPSLSYIDSDGVEKYGFSLTIRRTQTGRYKREVNLYNGSPVDWDILSEDSKIPNIYAIPLARTDVIYGDGLPFNVADFIESENEYKKIKDEAKEKIKEQMGDKINQFKSLCTKFDQNLDIDVTDPKISSEKLYILGGEKEHGVKIGSGYKSIANILLHTFGDRYIILLLDEIENHIHPSLLRTFLRELEKIGNITIVATTHSPVVINECSTEEILDISGKRLSELQADVLHKLNAFLHPGRGEIIFADNVILVEGYTEEMLLKNYLHSKSNNNWTVINAVGVMFKPYIDLARLLNKHLIVISDTDIMNSSEPSDRFKKLKEYCDANDTRIIEMENTLESDLELSGFIDKENKLLRKLEGNDYYVAKSSRYKTRIAQEIIDDGVDLSSWHVIKEIEDEFGNN